MRTSDLSNDERLVIERRRNMESQRDAAARHEVTLHRFRRWESGECDPPRVSIGRLELHEALFLARRRAGLSLRDAARRLGVSRWWLVQMEYGRAPLDRLREFWAEALAS